MTQVTFMNNPHYVDDRNDILRNSEYALQQLEKKQLLSSSKLENDAESFGQGNSVEDIEVQDELDYNKNISDLEDEFQKSLADLYYGYVDAYLGRYGGSSSLIGKGVNQMLSNFTKSLFSDLFKHDSTYYL